MASKRFEANIAQALTEALALAVAAKGARLGVPDGHQSELVVQDIIADLLTTPLPVASLVRQNEMLVAKSAVGKCIPDILIDRIDGNLWGIIELKTLFTKDNLSAALVKKDLQKLCIYKATYPDATSLFLLIGSRDRLFSKRRTTSWSSLKISYQQAAFSGGAPIPQAISATHVAVPRGSYSLEGFQVACFLWEVVEAGVATVAKKYVFDAQMA